jgi:hypothetical protein
MRHSLFLALGVTLALAAQPARAARLLLPEDVTDAPAATTPSTTAAVEHHQPPSFGLQFGVAAGAGVIGAPVGFLLANLLGNLSISLIPTAILGLVPMGLVAPALTALAGWLFGNWNLSEADGRYGFWLGFAAAAVVHIVACVIGGFAGLSLAGIPGLIVFSLVDGAAMGAASVGTMRFFRKEPAATATLPSFVPNVSDTSVVTLTALPF